MIRRHWIKASLDDSDFNNKIVMAELGNPVGLAAEFVYFNLDDSIVFCIGKIGFPAKFSLFEIVKIQICQKLYVLYQSLWKTGILSESFFF